MRLLATNLLMLAALTSPALASDTHSFNFASVGTSYSAAIFTGSPLIGRRITSATITLHLQVSPGSDAADFATDILLPILTDLPNSAVVAYSGEGLGWSGSGTFHHTLTTTNLNGTIVAARFGAETFGVQGSLLDGSGIVVTLAPLCRADLDDGTMSGNPDGAVTIDDLIYFLFAFEGGLPDADMDDGSGLGTPDGAVTIDDLLFYLRPFDSGC